MVIEKTPLTEVEIQNLLALFQHPGMEILRRVIENRADYHKILAGCDLADALLAYPKIMDAANSNARAALEWKTCQERLDMIWSELDKKTVTLNKVQI